MRRLRARSPQPSASLSVIMGQQRGRAEQPGPPARQQREPQPPPRRPRLGNSRDPGPPDDPKPVFPSARDCPRPAGTRPPTRCTFNTRHRARAARTPAPPRAPPASTDSPAPGPPPPRPAPSRSRPPPSGRTPLPRDPPGYRPSVAQPGPSQPQQQPEAEHVVRPPVDDDLVPPSAHRVPFSLPANPVRIPPSQAGRGRLSSREHRAVQRQRGRPGAAC